MAETRRPEYANRLIVVNEGTTQARRCFATELAGRLHLPVSDPAHVPPTAIQFVVTDQRLELRSPADSKDGPVLVDFLATSIGARGAQGPSGKELIARAVGFKRTPLTVYDATAGFARDAFVLALMGCTVRAIERSPVVVALVEDAIARARRSNRPRILEALDRLSIVGGDARTLLLSEPHAFSSSEPRTSVRADAPFGPLSQSTSHKPSESQTRGGSAGASPSRPTGMPNESASDSVSQGIFNSDVVYLDPMYPDTGRTALNRKELRMLRTLVGDDDNAAELLAVARGVAQRRVVVKRPLHAPPLAPNPDVQYKGKTVRYDVYLSPAQ